MDEALMLQTTPGYLLDRERRKEKRPTPLQYLILKTAAEDKHGLIIPNRSVPERVYRGMWWCHGWLERREDYYEITEEGRAALQRWRG